MVAVGIVAFLAALYVVYGGGVLESAGTVHDGAVPPEEVRARAARQGVASPAAPGAKQILFGDLHVHTTFSADAFALSLPLLAGEGAHPPADACDFARFCASLDFFALTDHAESLTPRRWAETRESVRQCNAVAGAGPDPDLVAFTGFEWSQVGLTPEEHYGHKNVIFRHTDDARLPVRPIASVGLADVMRSLQIPWARVARLPLVPILDFPDRQRYLDLVAFMRESASVSTCPEGVDPRELPPDCFEVAPTPQVLFEKLDRWGHEAMVIPHGTTWGFYTPPGYVWDKQLDPAQDDEARQRLIEVYSGHGNSEEHAPFRALEVGEDGELVCPEPTAGYEPCCWRAGEIIRSRCGAIAPAQCEQRVQRARANYLGAGVSGHLTVPGAMVDDWKDCGQCRDCFSPAYTYRPGGSAQYILAKGWFGEGGEPPRHATYGFIASSDNHTARPGTGYKDYARRAMTEATGPKSRAWRDRTFGAPREPTAESVAIERTEVLRDRMPWEMVDLERQASFFLTGGLVAVHAEGRDRDAIWDALQRREVYGTSGPRILLWFELVDSGGQRHPMGSEVRLGGAPRFVVRAAGAFRQKPGCPESSAASLGPEDLARLCMGECYHPSDERLRIDRIEVVRIRPQQRPEEDVNDLIEDVWRRYDCPAGEAGCVVELEDEDFASGGRDALYYVRAIQEPTPGVNAGQLRCTRDAAGACVEVNPCYGDFRTPLDDDCLAPTEERAWSSPIWVRFDAGAAAEP
jgi:hypothetical protein